MNDVSGWDPDWEISFSVVDPKRFDSDPDPIRQNKWFGSRSGSGSESKFEKAKLQMAKEWSKNLNVAV